MEPGKNRQILLAARPVGMIKETDFTRREVPVPKPQAGEYLVRNIYLSLDPTIRGWMNATDTYLPAIKIGHVMRGGGVGVVVESQHPQYAAGDIVFGMIGWQDFFLGTGHDAMPMMVLPQGVPLTAALSVLGITGMTAYFGLLDVGQPKAGETVVVSGAAGATGSVAGQIANIKGCHVVGIAGSPEKCKWVTDDLGFDACINYKTENIAARLKQTCPKGIDVYFDNVGGDILDAVLAQINLRARIVLCGAISMYTQEGSDVQGPRGGEPEDAPHHGSLAAAEAGRRARRRARPCSPGPGGAPSCRTARPKAEMEIRHLNEKMDLLLTSQWRRLLEIQRIQM